MVASHPFTNRPEIIRNLTPGRCCLTHADPKPIHTAPGKSGTTPYPYASTFSNQRFRSAISAMLTSWSMS
jgi:hypothetical protein